MAADRRSPRAERIIPFGWVRVVSLNAGVDESELIDPVTVLGWQTKQW
jgi:hypothetical protein